jgi:CubicO group peptidase (beta-lactamase class C family)
VERGVALGDPWAGVDAPGLARAVRDQSGRPVAGAEDMASYLAAQVSDVSHREVVGPLLDGLRGGQWGTRPVISRQWIGEMWAPCRAKPNYGLSWWLNDDRTVWPAAPATGRCARGNGGAHLLWVDPARDLVISSRWGAGVESLLAGVSAAVEQNGASR